MSRADTLRANGAPSLKPPPPRGGKVAAATKSSEGPASATRLLDVACALLEQGTFEATPIQVLTKRARTSVGAFYARFPDRAALIDAVHQRRCAQVTAIADEQFDVNRWRGAALEEVVETVTAFMVRESHTHRALLRELVKRNATEQRFRERNRAVATHTTRRIAAFLLDHAGRLAHKDVERAAEVIHRIIESVIDQHVLVGGEAPGLLALTPEQLAEELSAVVLGYLLYGGPR